MTTKVEVFAANGKAVDLIVIPATGERRTTRIEPGKHGTAYAYPGQDILVHEVTGEEEADPAQAADPAPGSAAAAEEAIRDVKRGARTGESEK